MATKAELETQVASLEQQLIEAEERNKVQTRRWVETQERLHEAVIEELDLEEEITDIFGSAYKTYRVTTTVEFRRRTEPARHEVVTWHHEAWNQSPPCQTEDDSFDVISVTIEAP